MCINKVISLRMSGRSADLNEESSEATSFKVAHDHLQRVTMRRRIKVKTKKPQIPFFSSSPTHNSLICILILHMIVFSLKDTLDTALSDSTVHQLLLGSELQKWRHPTLSLRYLQTVEAIRLIRIDVPQSIQAGQPLRLRCLYETKNDKLQSLSWYKNGKEFYRYQPFERRQPVLAFNLGGVHVDLTKSRNNTVVLSNTTSETSGRYKCEATGTSFQEVNMEAFVDVLSASSSSCIGTSVNHGTLVSILLAQSVILAICLFNFVNHH